MEVIETQELTASQKSKTFSRNDKVINFGKYLKVSNNIDTIIQMINGTQEKVSNVGSNVSGLIIENEPLITDAKLADWIRKTLQGVKISDQLASLRICPGHLKKLELLIVNLTYLLFGCEASRNPANFILHQMMLDLILYSNFSWKQMFNEFCVTNQGMNQKYNPLMPMAMINAVPSARILHEKFYNYMPFSYQYSGSEENEKSEELLRNRYPFLIHVWLTYYLKEPQKELGQAIKDSLLRWYNILPEQIEYQKPALQPK